MIKLKNIYLVFKDQMPLKRFYHNFFISGNAWGIFYKNSHIASYNNKEKIGYNTKKTALNAADKMTMKYPENIYKAYKCLWCDKFHIGKSKK